MTVEQQRIRQLEAENRQLRGEVEMLKKCIRLFCPGTAMSFQLVEQRQHKAVPVNQLCRVLALSRSGFYTARKRAQVQPVVCEASVHMKATFATSGGAYGRRRLRTAVASRGIVIGIYRLRRLMQKHGLRSVWKRKFVHTTDSKHALAISPNVLNRQFNPTRPNQAWVAGITYIRTRSGWLYLAVVLDLFARKVVGWAMDPGMQATLVCKALLLAIVQRHTEAMNDVAHYIVSFYNSQRLHSKLGNLPPNAFEQKSAIKQPINVCEKT